MQSVEKGMAGKLKLEDLSRDAQKIVKNAREGRKTELLGVEGSDNQTQPLANPDALKEEQADLEKAREVIASSPKKDTSSSFVQDPRMNAVYEPFPPGVLESMQEKHRLADNTEGGRNKAQRMSVDETASVRAQIKARVEAQNKQKQEAEKPKPEPQKGVVGKLLGYFGIK